MNRGCSGWVSSFIIVCYVSEEAICPPMCFKPRQSRGKHSASS